jgi:hypothetical protein
LADTTQSFRPRRLPSLPVLMISKIMVHQRNT